MIIDDGKIKTDDDTMLEYIQESNKEVRTKTPVIDLEEWENFFNEGEK